MNDLSFTHAASHNAYPLCVNPTGRFIGDFQPHFTDTCPTPMLDEHLETCLGIEKSLQLDPCLPALVSVVHAKDPVTKSFTILPDGALDKQTNGNLKLGVVSKIGFNSLDEFASGVRELEPTQCLMYGVAPQTQMGLMTKSAWYRAGCPDYAVPRTKDAFSWPAGPGILMLDYDAPKDGTAALTREELFASLYSVCPALANSDSLWMPSTSSEIYNSETNECIVGVKGQRIYFIVENASDIPRAGSDLLTHLWAAGHGRFEVSSSGSLLDRGVFDGSVWQTNRIDFAGGADCTAPLEQRRVPVVQTSKQRTVDSRAAIPVPTDDVIVRANRSKADARKAVATLAEQKRHDWRTERIDYYTSNNPLINRASASRMLDFAVEPGRNLLTSDWSITVVAEDGQRSVLTVGNILSDPSRYDGMLTLDPLEPEYDGGRPVGKLYLSGRQNLHSFAHGGVNFSLCNKIVKIEKRKGQEREMADDVMKVMRDHPEIFEFGNAVVRVVNGKPIAFNENSLRYWLGGVIQFCRTSYSNGNDIETLEEAPERLLKMILSLGVPRNFRCLNAVTDVPTLRSDGTLLTKSGYDPQSGLLVQLDQDNEIFIPVNPTVDQARRALDLLWHPFKEFPFVDANARAAHLAALLTASIRPAVSKVPAFGYDAPGQGTGKTLLAECVAIVTSGTKPQAYPPLHDDGEMRKRIFAALHAGERYLLLDNIVGTFDSASLAAMLTTEHFGDRILGRSEVISVPNKAIVLLTGNNIVLTTDMARRVIISRIDAKIETPFGRSFDLDPYSYCQEHRVEMVAAALTLVRFRLTVDGFKPASGRLASFEDWDKFVRQTVVCIGQFLSSDDSPDVSHFGDVLNLVKQNQLEDPERDSLRDLHQALVSLFGSRPFTAAEIYSACNRANPSIDSRETRLSEAIYALSPSPKLSPPGIGRLLKYRRDRLCDGMRLEVASDNKNGRTWRVAGGSQELVL